MRLAIRSNDATPDTTPNATQEAPVSPPPARKAPSGEPLIQPNAENLYRVTPADLPLSCPMPGMYLWNSHPRVYLAVEDTGRAKCGYCGAVYELVEAPAR